MSDTEIKLLLQETNFRKIRAEVRMYRVVFGGEEYDEKIKQYHREMDKCDNYIEILKKIINE